MHCTYILDVCSGFFALASRGIWGLCDRCLLCERRFAIQAARVDLLQTVKCPGWKCLSPDPDGNSPLSSGIVV